MKFVRLSPRALMYWGYFLTNILLKFHSLGLRGQLSLFLHQPINRRTIRIHCSSVLSRPFELDEGVQQGSDFSVLLSAIAFNNIVGSISVLSGVSFMWMTSQSTSLELEWLILNVNSNCR